MIVLGGKLLRRRSLIKCNTPVYMIVDVCSSCKRATKKKGKSVATYSPKKARIGWICSYYLPMKEK